MTDDHVPNSGDGAQDNLLSAPATTDSTPTSEHQSQKVDETGMETTTSILASARSASTRNIFTQVWNKWKIEILACGLALLALFAIVMTLIVHDGRPLPQWPFRISVNALVSVFAVILKASMMLPVSESISQLKWTWYQQPRPLGHLAEFDLASRGPWGCFKLLRRCHVRNSSSIGAAITILALAGDPFIQQMIRYRSTAFLLVTDDAQAFIPRSNNYSVHGLHLGAGSESLNLTAQAAVYKGVYNSYSAVEATCTSGNCTFEDYRTLGICSHCHDTSGTIVKSCNNESECTAGLQDGPSLRLPGSAVLNVSTVVGTGSFHHSRNVTGLSKSQLLGRIGAIPNELLAFECELYPCVRTYEASVAKGNFSETLLSTSPIPASDYSAFATYYDTPMPCLINGTYHNASEFVNPDATNTIATLGLLPENQTAYVPLDCAFWYQDPLGLAEYLGDFLLGSVNQYGTSTPDWLGQLILINNSVGAYPSFNLINNTWNALAESITIHMRENGDAIGSQPAAGSVYQTETCILVQWLWIIYPASLVALTLLFTAVTVYNSMSYNRDQIWKGSPLPLMLHGLDNGIRHDHCDTNELNEIEAMAKELRVHFQKTEDGWRLVEF
ncbi:hypothetical protein KCU62_g5567, partial [Aureobasidium sp. EXF-3399]